ncbi:hypothetical protein [Streptomyces sp. NPDC051569]|uniref:hypothetical protein n=1 Tax=Streptomyces sp. NPDC051569 TaxID=3365661 RepID=UPI0037A8CA8F
MRKTTAILAGISTTALLLYGTSPAQAAEAESPPPAEQVASEAPGPIGTMGAAGSAAIGTFKYTFGGTTITVPTGCFLTHVIKGSGKKITSQTAGVDCVGVAALATRFCNTQLEFHYADTAGKTYKIQRGPLNTTCKTGTVSTYSDTTSKTLPSYGKACAHLYVNGSRRSVQCHYITQ